MAYAVILLAIAACAIGAYLLLVFREVPGAIEERLGEYEALPEDLGKWGEPPSTSEAASAARTGEYCEVRLLHQPAGTFSREKLIRQVRFRDRETRQIVRVEPDEELKRRRVKR